MEIQGFQAPLVRPLLPKQVAELRTKVNEQVDQCLSGQTYDKQNLGESLQQLAQAARGLRAQATTPDALAINKTIGQLHASANKIASYAAMSMVGGAAGVASATSLEYLQDQKALFNQSLEKVFSTTAVEQVKIAQGPREDLIEFVEVPAGPFKAGYDHHEVNLPAYRLSKYPVTNQQYMEFVKATDYKSQGSWSVPEGGAYPPGEDSPGNHPCVNVTFYDAQAFAGWAGVRLPSEDEWEKGARGTDGRKYPWGNEWRPDLLNYDSSGTTPVTAFEKKGNVSPFGAVDMVGNVLEWVDTGPSRRPGAVLLKGGAFTNYLPENLDIQPFDCVRHTSESPESSYAGFGFRVCSDASFEPTVLDPKRRQSMLKEDAPPPVPEFLLKGPPTFADAKLTRLEGVVRDLKVVPEATDVKTMQQLLQEISAQVRSNRPLSASKETIRQRQAVNEVMAAANKMAYFAAFVAIGSSPAGMALASCVDGLDENFETLKSKLPLAMQHTQTTIQPAQGNPARLDWVEIPAGEFTFGRDKAKVHLDSYEVSKYPVTNSQFLEFIKDTGYKPEGGWNAPAEGAYPKDEHSVGDHPVVSVTYFDAQAFAKWAGGRLPTEKEWEKAGRGSEGLQFPWGNDWRPEAVQHDGEMTSSVYESEKKGNVSPYGVVDMVGNALEWVDDSTRERPGSVILKGGAWSNGSGSLKVFNNVRRTTENPQGAYRGFGFRIVRDSQAEKA
ncbi:SUMF1/EgtB/PvdO family nonheme iron enzyme [bacterium]|nr:SUMF1/EgtB/PvdO family nonheme iron enzyme [bacterium]